ncbi:MAG TPA: BTAD domain-containing putative transcriptional regulator [Amycolatopsis sp.]|uniref:AfsR/SARP family transcriptional regulator n=1 Tax=Amycolatopsis sp. TaxID=37632 RepID=UPI002B46FC10|nr:BTAD domain-containing putative transcriptional regulator [Amycolatopsis sp.]HKS48446.1 BTAD domain-containing putative transcriptional regulator [Amycolatopsis sp.]
MYFQLLGALKVQRDGNRVDLGGLRQQRLLAMLLLDANRVVSANRLIDAMWDDEPPVTARRQLHNAVAAIRRSFAAAKSIVVNDGPGYRIQVEAQDIDARRFTTLVSRASVTAAERRTAAAVELLEEALSLWEGPALSGLNSPVLDIAAATLEEKRLSATEQLLALRLDGGAAAALVPQLGELVSEHPLREETRRLLILALHGSGRKAEALNVYEQGRRLLREEIGVDPSAALRQLYDRILRDDLPQPRSRPEPGGPVSGGGGQPADHGGTGVKRSFLPYDTAHFTGRTGDLRSLTTPSPTGTALGIVVIDGMAGVGKTTLAVRLAHQLAHRYPEGHLFVDLNGDLPGHEPLAPDAALERLLLDFGLPPARIPRDGRQLAARWRAEVAERRILVVLDNAVDAKQVRPLLPGTGKALVIITSRRRLVGLDGVTSRSLDVFSPEDAVALFTRIAGADRTKDRPHVVAEIVALCGYLPLAISIAASRFHNRPAWSLEHMVFRLRDERGRLAELSHGDRSVMAAFETSYRNLSPELRRLFCVLSFGTHPCTEFDASAVAAMTNMPVTEADRLLEELFDAHMLGQHTAGHYHFQELLRAYARVKAAELDVDDDTLGALDPRGGVWVQAGV